MTFLTSFYTALLIAGCLKLVLVEYRRMRRTEQLLQLLDETLKTPNDQRGQGAPNYQRLSMKQT